IIGRPLQAAKLNGPADAKPRFQRRDDEAMTRENELPLHVKGAERQGGVVAPLRLEWHTITERGREPPRPRTGRYDEKSAGEPFAAGEVNGNLASLPPHGGHLRRHEARAVGFRMRPYRLAHALRVGHRLPH